MNIIDLLKVFKDEYDNENQEFSVDSSTFKNTYCIGHRKKSFWIGILEENPFEDGVLDTDKIEPFHKQLITNKGAFAVVWDVDQVIRFIYGHDGDYITPQNYFDHIGISYA